MPGGSPQTRPWRAALRIAPWVVVLAFWAWSAWPLWFWTEELAFAGKLTTDNVVSAWFYDYASRAVGGQGDLAVLEQLHHPDPHPTWVEFPAVMDAVLAAPLGWLLGWPRQWGAAQSLALLVNGLGAAVLARGMGARGLGVAVAGCLAVVCRPVWKDLVMARMNAVWPGLGLLAVGALLLAMRQRDPAPIRAWAGATGWASLAALSGALAATIYPPALLLLAPLALPLVLSTAAETRWPRWLLAAGALGLGLAVAWPELMRILGSRSGQAGLGELGCPDRWAALNAVDLWRTRPDASQGLSEPALVVSSWAAASLVLFDKRRWMGVATLGLCALWLLLSLGPCAEWVEGSPWNVHQTPVVGDRLAWLWRQAAPLHDFGRFAGVAVLMAGVLTGLGLDALAGDRRWRQALAALAGVALVSHVQWVVLSERLSPTKWHDATVPATARFLSALPEADLGPAVELPFDRKQQFLSLIGAPEPPRLNPLRPGDNPPVRAPSVEWLYRVGFAQLDGLEAPPAFDPGLVTWVFFDPSRCGVAGVPRRACSPQVETWLTEGLGEPRLLDDGTRAWAVGGWSEAAAGLLPRP